MQSQIRRRHQAGHITSSSSLLSAAYTVNCLPDFECHANGASWQSLKTKRCFFFCYNRFSICCWVKLFGCCCCFFHDFDNNTVCSYIPFINLVFFFFCFCAGLCRQVIGRRACVMEISPPENGRRKSFCFDGWGLTMCTRERDGRLSPEKRR